MSNNDEAFTLIFVQCSKDILISFSFIKDEQTYWISFLRKKFIAKEKIEIKAISKREEAIRASGKYN